MDWPAPAPLTPLRLPLEEGGHLELHPAGLATRLAARIVDGLCQVLLAGACLLVPALILERTAAESQVGASARVGVLALAAIGILASAWLYPVVFELAWRGRTPGKHLLGLQVTDARGRPPSATAVVVRNLLLLVDILPGAGLVGLIVAARDSAHRRVGDLVAGTFVVQSPAIPTDT